MSDSNAVILEADIENALMAARMGVANDDDWSLIYFAAGLTQPTERKETNDFDGSRR